MRRRPMRGADLVLLARHRRWKGVGLCHNTLLAVECDGPIEAERVTRALERFLDACPWPAARLRRPFPWGKLHWVAGPRERLTCPPVRRASVISREQLRRELIAELNARIEPRREPPLRVLLLDGEPESGSLSARGDASALRAPALPAEPFSLPGDVSAGPVEVSAGSRARAASSLVLTWFHPLMDARGGQNLLTHLAYLDRHESEIPWGGEPPAFLAERDPRPFRERGRIAGGSREYMRTLAPVPPVSPAARLIPPGRACFRLESFVGPDPTAADRRGTREISWRLAVVGKAMAELWRERGLPDVPFLLPISVDLRPKGELGPTFGNQLAFHFARFRPSETVDVPALARALRRQMADAVRDGQIEANAVAMEFLQYYPRRAMLRVLPWTAGGELFSFNCADLADWPPALEQCFGRRVVNAYHVPVVPPRPGIGVFFNRCGSRNNLVVSWIEGVVSEAEAARIIEVVREGMEWTRVP